MTIFKQGTVWSISQDTEMAYHVTRYIQLGITSYGTNNEMYHEIICVDGMGEWGYNTYA